MLKAIRARVGFGSGTETSTGIIKELADIENIVPDHGR